MRVLLFIAAWALLSANASHQDRRPDNERKQESASTQPLAVPNQPRQQQDQQTEGCRYAGAPNVRCEAVTANAAVRQAVAAEDQAVWTEYAFYAGLATAFIAGLAAWFARSASVAARKSLDAFTEVEQSLLFVTIENYTITGSYAGFDVVAYNLGRSALLVTSLGEVWLNSSKLEDFKGCLLTPHPVIVPAAGTAKIKAYSKRLDELKSTPFLWMMVETGGALNGKGMRRLCFEIFLQKPAFINQPYGQHRADDLPPPSQRPASLWGRLKNALHVRRG